MALESNAVLESALWLLFPCQERECMEEDPDVASCMVWMERSRGSPRSALWFT